MNAQSQFVLDLMGLVNQPALIAHSGLGFMHSVIEGKIRLQASGKEAVIYSGSESPERHRPYTVVDGVAYIPVYGVLINRMSYWWKYATGYDSIVSRVKVALDDTDVEMILLDINSPGGMVAGCFETAEFLTKSDREKPLYAHVNNQASSAAYALASGCRQIWATSSAELGSIGVVLTHWSYEQALDRWGEKVTHIFAGKHKIDGNPFQDIPKAVKEKFQSDVMDIYDKFTSLVAEGRKLNQQTVIDTEAEVFSAPKAIELGLADKLVAGHALPDFLMNLTQQKEQMGVITMSEQSKDQPRASDEALSDARDEGKAAGMKAATERIKSILACEEAKGRESLAEHLAYNTRMESASAVEALKVALRAAPIEEASTHTQNSAFQQAMNRSEHPEVVSEEESEPEEGVSQVAKTFALITG